MFFFSAKPEWLEKHWPDLNQLRRVSFIVLVKTIFFRIPCSLHIQNTSIFFKISSGSTKLEVFVPDKPFEPSVIQCSSVL